VNLSKKTTNPNTMAPRLRTSCVARLLPLLLLLALTATVQAQFTYTTNNDGSLNIASYTGSGGAVIIPDTTNGLPITSIGTNAFKGAAMSSLVIGTNVISIGAYAFQFAMSMTNITIPNSVTSIGDQAFAYCSWLKAITVDTNNPAFSSVAGVLFNQDQTTLIACPGGILGSYTIPTTVTSIGTNAFILCQVLTRVTIPNSVTNIEFGAFFGCNSLTNITIGNSVASIEDEAFTFTSLRGAYFHGNAPGLGVDVFGSNRKVIVYYLPGSTNWGTTFGGRPTMLWNPQAQTSDASFGVRTNQFGFNITGTTNIPIVIEACADLASPAWVPLQGCTLTNGSVYFCDPQWTNYPGRFYHLRTP
jgi:hypothetical protein